MLYWTEPHQIEFTSYWFIVFRDFIDNTTTNNKYINGDMFNYD